MGESPKDLKRHEAIAAELLADIGAGLFPVGGAFPVEAELQDRFSVGRHTIRMALGMLTEQGLIGRRQRVGTVVLSQRPVYRFAHSLRDVVGLSDFAQATVFEISRQGFVLNNGRSDLLNFDKAARRWARFAGVRYARSDNTPICWSELLVPDYMTPDRQEIIESPDPMYQLVMKQQGFELAAVEQEIQATQLSPAIADLLKAQAESAALVVQRRYVNNTGFTFEVAVNFYPAERYSVRSVLKPSLSSDGGSQLGPPNGRTATDRYVMRFT